MDELPAIQAGDAGKVLSVKSDESGVEFVMPSGGGESKTTEDIEFYVNPATGSDENDGLSAATPFATIAHALSLVPKIINHYVSIELAAGSYTEHVYIEGFTTEITSDQQNDYLGNLEIHGPGAIFTKDAMTDHNCANLEVWRTTSPWNYNPATVFFISGCDIPILIGGRFMGGNNMIFDMTEGYESSYLPPYQASCGILAVNCKQPIWVYRCTFKANTGEKKGGVWAFDTVANVSFCDFNYCNAFYARADGPNGNIVMGEATESNVSEVVCRLLATNHGKVTIGAMSDPYTLDDGKDLMTFGGRIFHHNEEKPLKKNVALYVTRPSSTDEHYMDWDSEDYAFPSIQAALDSLPKRIDSVVTINVNDGARTESAIFEGFLGAGQIKVFVYDDGASSLVPGTAPKVVQLSTSTSVKATLAFVGNRVPIEVKGYNATYKLSVRPYAEAGSAAIVAVNNEGLIRLEAVTLAPASGSEDLSSGILAMNSPVYITGSVVNEMAEVAKVLAGGRVELNTLTGSGNVKLYDCAANGHLSVDASTIANCAKTGSNTIAVDSTSVTWPELIRAFGPRIWSGETDPSTSAKAGDIWINATAVKIRNEANNDWITIS